ncbi:MAG: hypothetical protein NT075_32975 [Chloroflexi bacterium]|nr:hypothetical protein [Chloroflexota bacterium]
MLWDYSCTHNNNDKVQFLLPLQNNLEASTTGQDESITAENQQALRKLCQEFLTQLGYPTFGAEISKGSGQLLALESGNQQSLDEMRSMLQALAMCAALRERSAEPMTKFNRLLGSINQLIHSD